MNLFKCQKFGQHRLFLIHNPEKKRQTKLKRNAIGMCPSALQPTQQDLTIFPHDKHSDVSTADDFWKHCYKQRNYSNRAISSFATTFSTVFKKICHKYIFLYSSCMIFKLVCCRFIVSGKGFDSRAALSVTNGVIKCACDERKML